MLIVDAFAWVEFIIGSDRGRRVKKYIEGDES